MFSALSLLVFCFLFFFEALVLARSLSFGNLVSRSCSTYFDKVTTFSLLKISFSSSVSHETMADNRYYAQLYTGLTQGFIWYDHEYSNLSSCSDSIFVSVLINTGSPL